MSKFMYVFRGGAFVTPGLSPTDLQTHLNKWRAWVGALSQAGHAQAGGHPLQNAGKTIRGRDRIVTDGPYAESKDLVTGNLVVEAASLEQATELARDCPVYEFDGSVEIRSILDRNM
jgi:hypothetical protein